MIAADTIRDLPLQVKRCPDCGSSFGIDAAFCPFDGVALSVATWDKAGDPLTGTRVDGRYEVLEPLGQGGMGAVYRVRHVTLDRLFAMKVLRRDLADDAELAKRFVHEARATAAVKHPGVVQITDFGELEDRTPYFVMELLVGETLATRIRARGPLPPALAIGVARRIAEALEASHAAGVIHRDLKPDNVFLVGRSLGRAAEEEVRLVDFGAARVAGTSRLTRPGVVFGTPYYMSPEQASGQAVDARADVYSLGVLLYEMVTGALPFEADTYMGVLTKHMFAEPTPPSQRISSGVRLGPLEAVILKCLAKDPAARHASMAEMSRALGEAEARLAVPTQGEAGPPPGATAEVIRGLRRDIELGASKAERIQASLERRIAEESRRRRTHILVAVAGACSTLVFGGGALWFLEVERARSAPAEQGQANAASASAAPPVPAPSSVAPATSAVPVAEAPPSVASEAPSGRRGAPADLPPVDAPPILPATSSRTPPGSPRPPREAARPTAAPSSGPAASAPPKDVRPVVNVDTPDFPDPWKR